MYGAVDLLASEYGWAYKDILYKIYPDDFFLLSRQIKMRRVDGYLMDYMITASTQSEDREFIDELVATQRFMAGIEEHPEELDREALDAWRSEMGQGSKAIKTGIIKT